MPAAKFRGRIVRLCQKELKETLRDRRTIITLVMMPLLVYPLLSMALNRFLLSSGGPADQGYSIGVISEGEAAYLTNLLEDPNSQPPDEVVQASGGTIANFRVVGTGDLTPRQALEENQIDLAVEITLPSEGDDDKRQRFRLTAYEGDAASEAARRILIERLEWLRLREAESFAANESGYTPRVKIEVESVGEVKSSPMLATVIPLVLVLMTITGAVYPAIDLTAGERERGTMEALMASPVPRSYVLFAKYIAVVTVALLTAIANLLAMFSTLYFAQLLPMLTGQPSFPWLTVLQILGLLVLFSGFFSALLLSLTSFAKSFKEAQTYLIPVMLLSLTPGMLSLMPGVELKGPLAIAPLINIVLLARDLLAGTVTPTSAVAAVLSTIAYAAAALSIAAKLFGSDAVLRTSEQSFASMLRRPESPSAVPSMSAALMMLALLVPIYFVVSNSLMQWLQSHRESLSVSSQLLLNAAALIATFGFVPLITAWLGRHVYRTTFRLSMPTPTTLIGCFLMGIGAWAIAHEAFVIADAAGIGGLSQERIEQTMKVLGAWKQVPPWLLVATLALTPAVIEELCFRGFLFSALSKSLSPMRVIVITSVVFGLFHVLTGNALLIERFVPSTLLGLMLGWIAYRSGSVIPGMLMHLTHNGLLELVGRYHEYFSFLGSDLEDQTHLPWQWIVVASGIAIAGAGMVWWSTRREPQVRSLSGD